MKLISGVHSEEKDGEGGPGLRACNDMREEGRERGRGRLREGETEGGRKGGRELAALWRSMERKPCYGRCTGSP